MGKTHRDICETHIIGRDTREWVVGPQLCPALAGHGVSLCGISQAGGGFRFVRHAPQMAQVLACVGGEGRVLVGERWLRCRAGEAYLTPPNVRHAYHGLTGRRWRVAWAHLGPLELAGPAVVRLDAAPLAAAIEGLYREGVGPREPAVMQTWATLVAQLAKRAAGAPDVDARLQELWPAVDRDLSHGWTCGKMAQRIGLSAEHLRRLCVTQLGTSPMRYLTQLRLRRADSLLRTGAYRVASVARLVGYQDAFAFSVAFRRQFGLPPSQVIPEEEPPPLLELTPR